MPENEFPQAILHLDGDAFFVACEVARNPGLKGKPVVTGGERHIASAMSYEAKALGVTRGMPVFMIRNLYPQVIILPSDYKTYKLYSQRMCEIVRRYSEVVEEYSIDECFANITGLDHERGQTFEEISREIQGRLFLELGISFSVGLSVTKVLAKIASKHNKPRGLTIIPKSKIAQYVKELPIQKVWGIGGQTSAYLLSRGIKTAGDFVAKTEDWVKENCSKPYHEIWLELRGIPVYRVNSGAGRVPKSISSTGTFYPASTEKSFVFSEISKHIEDITFRARALSLVASEISFFLKTSQFDYFKRSVSLSQKTALPHIITPAIKNSFEKIFEPGVSYRATGATLYGLIPEGYANLDLFGETKRLDALGKIFNAVDNLSEKFGSGTVFMGSSLFSKKTRRDKKAWQKNRKPRKFFSIPFLGRTR